MDFKVGDWTRDVLAGSIQRVLNADIANGKYSTVEHWRPREGELFWGPRELHHLYPYNCRIELFQVKMIHKDGTYSLISPLDKNVYSHYIDPEDVESFLSKCEPFFGTPPTITKG